LSLGIAVFLAIAALTFGPRGFEAQSFLIAQDDPSELVERRLDRAFTAAVAAREIRAALAADDAELAASFVELARDRNVPVEAALAAQVEAANTTAANATRAAGSFARGLVVGEPEDLVGLVGTTVGDLFVIGDIRDAVREGTRLAMGEPADELVLGLAGLGLAVTAGTYATLGAGAPGRVGLSVINLPWLNRVDDSWLLARFANIYVNMEIQNIIVERRPHTFGEILMGLCRVGGSAMLDRLFWGSGGTLHHPRPGLEAFMEFEFSEDHLEHGGLFEPIRQLTRQDKENMLSGTYAKLHGLDIDAMKAATQKDEFARASNDVAPSAYNRVPVPDGLPDPPLPPAPEQIGLRWLQA
jgi:hypothetical protein